MRDPRLSYLNLPPSTTTTAITTANAMAASSIGEVTASTCSQITSSTDLCWPASDCSTPPTPTFSVRSHSRIPSSNSSLTSSPSPLWEHPDGSSSSSKLPLPKLAEHPLEREDNSTRQRQSILTESGRCGLAEDNLESRFADVTAVAVSPSDAYDFEKAFFSDEPTSASQKSSHKRRKSEDSILSPISARLTERFPSFARRLKHRKQDSKFADTGLHITTSPMPPSTRSSSLSSSVFQILDQNEPSPTVPKTPTGEASAPQSPVETSQLEIEEPIDRQKLASTPLLPPMLAECQQQEDRPVISPLQSPSVAESTHSFSTPHSLVGTPQLRGLPSPPLSAKPSVSSFYQAHGSTLSSGMPSPLDISTLVLADPNDKWTIKLGHANFTIEPEPYIPEVCDAASCRKLVADWERARINYFRHQHRTIEHYGLNSKTYKLTEDKWAEIDAEWKRSTDVATQRAAESSADTIPVAPTEPAPITAMPAVHDENKFPKLGDQDIVGPMVQIAARVQDQSRKSSGFLKLFSGVKIPTSLFGRRTKR